MLNSGRDEFNEIFKGWTCLNFHTRTFFISDGKFSGTPANQYQHEFFMVHFVEKGKRTCSFMEFRDLAYKIVYGTSDYSLFTEYYDFNHKRPDSIKYGKIDIKAGTFYHLFRFLDNKTGSLEYAFQKLIRKYEELKNESKNDQKLTKEETEIMNLGNALKTIIKTLNN